VTYNVHRCLGVDGVLSPERIAEVLAECNADVIALQELDVGRARSDRVDQAHAIAHALEMGSVHFHPAWQVLNELYGDAILTSLPSTLLHAAALPSAAPWVRHREPRGALLVEVEVGGTTVQILNTHLGLGRRERHVQAGSLLGSDWLESPACKPPLILTGDFNSLPAGRVYRMFARRLRDAHVLGRTGRIAPTFPSSRPVFRIDHVFTSETIEPLSAQVWRSPAAQVASDHLPLVVDLHIQAGEQAAA
jgi:endonuclease/exonuclease/phosphatase family metal-dependent hydrolase